VGSSTLETHKLIGGLGKTQILSCPPLFQREMENRMKIGHVLLLVGLMLVVIYASNNFAPLKNIVG
jgi:hypothetical protein